MKRNILKKAGISALICGLCVGLFFGARLGVASLREELSKYVDLQVDQKMDEMQTMQMEKIAELQSEMTQELDREITEAALTENAAEAAAEPAGAEGEDDGERAEIILPKVLYFQKPEEGQQYNLYYNNFAAGSYSVCEVAAAEGELLNDCYRLETKKIKNNLYEAVIRLFSADNQVVASKSVICNFVEPQSDDEINLMCIGDSWTEMGNYCGRIRDQVNNMNLLGVMEKPGEDLPRVGLGGWSLYSYATNYMTELDSPFLFPVGVSGSQYKGCVQTMRNIVTCDDGAYNSAQFKRFARGWQEEGEYLWDENGYYKYPEVGDVMADGERPEGERYLAWDGSQWVPMENQPEGYEFSFEKYMERFAACFEGKTPTHVSILTGANDFTYGCNEDEVEEWIDAYLDPVIQSIHAYDPDITVLIAFGQLGSDQDAFGSTFGTKISSRQYNASIRMMAKTLISHYDDDAYKQQGIYLVPIYATLDTEHGYSTEVEQMDSYTDEMVERHDNALHPNSKGMSQVGDAFLGILEWTRGKGEGRF